MLFPEIWKNIEQIDLSLRGEEFDFVQHLALENQWSHEYSEAAVLEYKRFAYLCAVDGQELTPSEEVDQVWRLHLADTRHYWGTFRKALGMQLHHQQPAGGEEAAKQRLQDYERLFVLYKDEFECDPPSEFWPNPSERFEQKQRFVRVDEAKNLILSKPTKALWRSVGRFIGVSMFPLSVVGYAVAQTSSQSYNLIGFSGWMVVAGIAIVIAFFGCLVWRMEHSRA